MFSLEMFLMMGLVKLDKLHVSTRKGKGDTRQRDRQTETDKQRQRGSQRQTETDRKTGTKREPETERLGDRQT